MSYRIPLFDLNFDKEEERAVVATLRSKWISTGPKAAELEDKFSQMLQVKYSVALANCTAALHLALRLVGVKAGDEVITPSLTFVATVNAIKYAGAVPVFCDIKGVDDLTIDPARVEGLITKQTKAIMVMHFAGFPCDMDAILSLARKYNLKVVEDACHGPLSEYKGRKLGTLGDIGCFSFFANKNISTGEGGMLVTNNEEYFRKCKLLRSHGMTTLSYERSQGHANTYDVVELGYNYRMDDIRASIGIVQLEKLASDLSRRSDIRKHYIEQLDNVADITVPFKNHSQLVSNYIMPIVIKKSTAQLRNRIREGLRVRGIETSIHYPAAHKFSIYQPRGNIDLPWTNYVSDNEITLPMYGKLKKNHVRYIVGTLADVLAGAR